MIQQPAWERRAAPRRLEDRLLQERLGEVGGATPVAIADRLEHLRAEVRERERLKEEFLLTVSHELRTPLAAIIGFTDLLTMEPELAGRPELDLIQESTRRMQSLIEDVLMLAQLRSGTMRLHPDRVDVAGIARRATVAAAENEDARHLQIRCHGTTKPAWAKADGAAVETVVRHLVSNAVKFTPSGSIDVRVTRQREHVRVTVADTGIGVPPDARRFLFEPFRQVDQSVTRRFGGLGVGLSVVRSLLRLQGGDVGVLGRRGGGSTFWFTVPAARAA